MFCSIILCFCFSQNQITYSVAFLVTAWLVIVEGFGSCHGNGCILDMGGEGFEKGLEVGVDISRNMFSGGTIRGDDGMAGVTMFMHFRRGCAIGG